MFKIDASLIKHTAELMSGIQDGVSSILRQAAENMQRDIKGPGVQNQYENYPHACPFKTGNLRASYKISEEHALSYKVFNDAQIAYYAVYQEFGPRPHFRASYEVWAAWAKERLRRVLSK